MADKEPLDAPTYHEEAKDTLPSQIAPGEIVLGKFVGMDAQGRVLVDFAENPSSRPLVAISTVSLTHQQIDRTVALLFSEGDLGKPVIIGLIHSPLYAMLESFSFQNQSSGEDVEARETASKSTPDQSPDQAERQSSDTVHVDDERLVIEGKKEIVLKCGEASITLTRAGKILIRGKYLLNRSSGVNRIMGGSVQVN